jgi:hypothetical protein
VETRVNEIETDRGDALRSPLHQGFVPSPSATVYLHRLEMCYARVEALECHRPGDRLNADTTTPTRRGKKEGELDVRFPSTLAPIISEQTA